MSAQQRATGVKRGLLIVATVLAGALASLGAPSPAAASAPPLCGNTDLSLITCTLVPSRTGQVNLSKDAAMTALTFTTDVGVPDGRTVIAKSSDNNVYFQPLVSNATNPPVGLLPPGMSAQITGLNPYGLRFSGTPTASGTWAVGITVTDGPYLTPGDYTESASYVVTIVVTADTTAPALQSATMPSLGNQITLSYNEPLTARGIATSSYVVTVDGNPATVSAASASASTVTLTLASPVKAGATVVVSYVKPGSNPVEDAAGNDATNLTSQAVTNNSTRDLTAPILLSSEVGTAGDSLELTYDENIALVGSASFVKALSAPVAADFSIMVGSSPRTVSSLSLSGSVITLTLGSTVYTGETLTVGHTPSTGNEIADAAGNAAAPLSSRSVTNRSTVLAPTTTTEATTPANRSSSSAPSANPGVTSQTPNATTTIAPTTTEPAVLMSGRLPRTGSSTGLVPALVLLLVTGALMLAIRRRTLTR